MPEVKCRFAHCLISGVHLLLRFWYLLCVLQAIQTSEGLHETERNSSNEGDGLLVHRVAHQDSTSGLQIPAFRCCCFFFLRGASVSAAPVLISDVLKGGFRLGRGV